MSKSSTPVLRPYGRAVRVYHCVKCNHQIRFGSSNCGRCNTAAPILNRKITWAVITGLAVVSFIYAIL